MNSRLKLVLVFTIFGVMILGGGCQRVGPSKYGFMSWCVSMTDEKGTEAVRECAQIWEEEFGATSQASEGDP